MAFILIVLIGFSYALGLIGIAISVDPNSVVHLTAEGPLWLGVALTFFMVMVVIEN
jgi:hypothetical protein